MQEEFRTSVIIAGSQKIIARANPVPLALLRLCLGGKTVGESIVGVVPAVLIADFDFLCDCDNFSKQRAAVLGGSK